MMIMIRKYVSFILSLLYNLFHACDMLSIFQVGDILLMTFINTDQTGDSLINAFHI